MANVSLYDDLSIYDEDWFRGWDPYRTPRASTLYHVAHQAVMEAGPPQGYEFEFCPDGSLTISYSRHFRWGVWVNLKGGSQRLMILQLQEVNGDYRFVARHNIKEVR